MERAREFTTSGRSRLLQALPEAARSGIEAASERVSLGLKAILYEPNAPITHVYFPLSGVMSLVIEMQDGEVVEVATVGNEGFVGSPVFLGTDRSPTKAFAQVPGEVLKVAVEDFKRELQEQPALHELIRRYTQALMNQISQSTACNHLHSIQERMCRWLLMTHDRVGADQFSLTQEFLSQMLGVRRASVTVVAGILQQARLIEYQRGRIKVLNRAGLEEGACECYRVVRDEYDRLLG